MPATIGRSSRRRWRSCGNTDTAGSRSTASPPTPAVARPPATGRGLAHPDSDFALVYDLLVGPRCMRAVVWGEQLAPDAADRTADVILTAFAPTATPGS